jgi:phenylalanyl-tRNA synthetase alpha chain
MDIKDIKERAKKEVKLTQNTEVLKDIFQKYLGKKGEVTHILRSLKSLPESKKKKQGQAANEVCA